MVAYCWPDQGTSYALLKCLLFPDMVAVDWLVRYVIFPQWRPLSAASGSRTLVFTMHRPHPKPCFLGSVMASWQGSKEALAPPAPPPSTCTSPTRQDGGREIFVPELGPELGQPESGQISSPSPAPVFPDFLLATGRPHPLFLRLQASGRTPGPDSRCRVATSHVTGSGLGEGLWECQHVATSYQASQLPASLPLGEPSCRL